KTHRKFDAPISEFFDFEHAKTLSEDPKLVRFEVPLHSDRNWLFPVDKVAVTVTVNKESKGLEHLTARVREPFKVLLGIARITGGALDLTFEEGEAAPADAKPSGSAQVSVSRFGERVDFTWSDFKRVTPFKEPNAALTRQP